MFGSPISWAGITPVSPRVASKPTGWCNGEDMCWSDPEAGCCRMSAVVVSRVQGQGQVKHGSQVWDGIIKTSDMSYSSTTFGRCPLVKSQFEYCHETRVGELPWSRLGQWFDFRFFSWEWHLSHFYLDSIRDKNVLCMGAVNEWWIHQRVSLTLIVNALKNQEPGSQPELRLFENDKKNPGCFCKD